MSERRCSKCGNLLLAPDARFCRHCGQPQSEADGVSITEATTRILESPPRATNYNSFTPNTYAPLSSNVTPNVTAHLSGVPTTQGLNPVQQKQGRKIVFWILTVLLLFVLIAPVVVYQLVPRTVIVKKTTKLRPPSIPPVPPLPSSDVSAIETDALTYPNAKIEQKIVRDGETSVVRMTSDDSFDKVVE